MFVEVIGGNICHGSWFSKFGYFRVRAIPASLYLFAFLFIKVSLERSSISWSLFSPVLGSKIVNLQSHPMPHRVIAKLLCRNSELDTWLLATSYLYTDKNIVPTRCSYAKNRWLNPIQEEKEDVTGGGRWVYKLPWVVQYIRMLIGNSPAASGSAGFGPRPPALLALFQQLP